MAELKPCPFCGGEAVISVDPDAVEDTQGRRWAYNAVCIRCCATSGLTYTSQKAKEAWNRRAEVVYGRWVTHYRSGTTVAEGYVSTCCDMWNNRKSNYCPHCGAKMDGGDSE